MKSDLQNYGNQILLVCICAKFIKKIAINLFLTVIATELVNASSTDDISSHDFRMQNSIFIPTEFIQQRSSIAGKYDKVFCAAYSYSGVNCFQGINNVPIATIHYTNIQNILPVISNG